mmetsp:Transcript_67520/g.109491  ORF Transcript_67520/g.109491 Transcript_67520/m.109491 type:complete len:99 (+) Transcript_67520:196-492(+)
MKSAGMEKWGGGSQAKCEVRQNPTGARQRRGLAPLGLLPPLNFMCETIHRVFMWSQLWDLIHSTSPFNKSFQHVLSTSVLQCVARPFNKSISHYRPPK